MIFFMNKNSHNKVILGTLLSPLLSGVSGSSCEDVSPEYALYSGDKWNPWVMCNPPEHAHWSLLKNDQWTISLLLGVK